MDRQDDPLDSAIKKGIQAAAAEKDAKEAARKTREAEEAQWNRDDARRLAYAYNEASKIADDSGLRAKLKKLDDMSGNRIHPTEYKEHDGSLSISTGIPTQAAGPVFSTLPAVTITVHSNGTISAKGDFTGTVGALFDSVSAKRDAAPILAFVAKYAQRANLFSPKA